VKCRALIAVVGLLTGCAGPLPTSRLTTASDLPVGKSQFEFVDAKGDPSRPITVWMFVPESCDAKCPLQFVMHGVQRNGEEYLNRWVTFAAQRKFIVVAPEFSRKFFPHDNDYSLGRSTTEPDANKWAFSVPEHLFDELKSRYGLSAQTYRMFGHSAGGQFVHRLHLFSPEHRANPIVAANPGWYTLLQWGLAEGDALLKFPYTTIQSKVDAAQAKRALQRPFILLLGDQDIDVNDPSLNKSKGANAQGLNRFARGENFAANARAAAEKLGVAWNWQVQTVPGAAHDHAAMARAAMAMMSQGDK
jgi:poly(3-hydroxybutyrate) depolymerase